MSLPGLPRFLALFLLLLPALGSASEPGAVQKCLRAWGDHPFGPHPHHRLLNASVKVFGIGQSMDDLRTTQKPELVLVESGVNLMGGSTMQLMNPNGWYCFASNVNVMGSLTIRAHCKAHLASAIDGVTVMGGDSSNNSVTVMGSTQVERVGCPD